MLDEQLNVWDLAGCENRHWLMMGRGGKSCANILPCHDAICICIRVCICSTPGGGRRIGSCFMGLRRLSRGLIASSLSTTNWSWRPGIISSNQFSHPDDRSNIFKHNIGDAEGQACIGLKLIGSSEKKTPGGKCLLKHVQVGWGETPDDKSTS